MWNSLRVRLTLIFIGLAILPLIIAGGVVVQTTNVAAKGQAIVLESQIAQNAASKVTNYLYGLTQNLFDLGDQISSLSMSIDLPDRALYSALMSNEFGIGNYGNDYEELTLLNPQGKEIVRISHEIAVPDNQLLDHSKSNDYLQPASTRQAYYSPVSVDTSTGQPYFTISVPLSESSNVKAQLKGVLIAKIGLSSLESVLTQAQPGPNQTLYITDAEGKVFIPFNIQTGRIALPAGTDIQTGLEHANSVLSATKIQLPLSFQTLYVVAEQPTTVALSLENDLITTLILTALIVLFLSTVAGLAIARQIVLPIEKLAVTAKQIAQGDFSQAASVRSHDEIGTLSNTFNEMTAQLRNLVGSLEQRVLARTQDLEHQTSRVRTSAEVARDIASAPNLDELLTRSGQLIVDRFNFYHAGIFLLDDKKEYAVLRASPTEAGKQLIANNHRLRVGEQGIVGRVAASGEARIALDTGADAVYFNNPLLPATHSEMALPLKTTEGILGVLDVQSEQPQAFTREDIEIIQVMADQLAIAIERTRLLKQVEDQLKEIEQTYGEYTRRSWKSFAQTEKRIAGYKFDGAQLQPIDQTSDPSKEIIETDLIKDIPGTKPDALKSQAFPIRLRGQVIGFVTVRLHGDSKSRETTAIIEQITDRLASALENARLTEETRQRAQRERSIAEISTKISSFSDIDSIMRSAVEELGIRLGSSTEVTLELGSDDQE